MMVFGKASDCEKQEKPLDNLCYESRDHKIMLIDKSSGLTSTIAFCHSSEQAREIARLINLPCSGRAFNRDSLTEAHVNSALVFLGAHLANFGDYYKGSDLVATVEKFRNTPYLCRELASIISSPRIKL